MKFGTCSIEEAIGALAAHSVRAGDISLRKGSRITPEIAAGLHAAGIRTLVAVHLEPGDVGEDEAAFRLAMSVAGACVRVEAPFTGRANLFALQDGVLVVARESVDGINRVDESVTLATLPAFRPVVAGEMIGTVKIIPYAVPAAILQEALERAAAGPALRVTPYARRRIGVVSTLAPGLKASVVAKTLRVLGERLVPAGASIVASAETAHETDALADALRIQADGGTDLIVVFGASAIADRRDVIPAAIEAAGGVVEHFGMPVDPGNLMLIGRIGQVPVIGAPGCARSSKENGFDWVLQRLLAGIAVGRDDVTALGVGGLLMETVIRGQPRAGGAPADDHLGEHELGPEET